MIALSPLVQEMADQKLSIAQHKGGRSYTLISPCVHNDQSHFLLALCQFSQLLSTHKSNYQIAIHVVCVVNI